MGKVNEDEQIPKKKLTKEEYDKVKKAERRRKLKESHKGVSQVIERRALEDIMPLLQMKEEREEE